MLTFIGIQPARCLHPCCGGTEKPPGFIWLITGGFAFWMARAHRREAAGYRQSRGEWDDDSGQSRRYPGSAHDHRLDIDLAPVIAGVATATARLQRGTGRGTALVARVRGKASSLGDTARPRNVSLVELPNPDIAKTDWRTGIAVCL